jgi:serine/threonine-protein kinase
VSDDTHLWSQAYDEVIDDIFKVQSEIAGKVIEKTGIALLERHQRALDFRPTENLEAYRAYVRGLEFIRVPDQTQENFQLQVDLFRRAVELDPGFALAHATLARAHAGLYHFGFDRTEERQALARGAVDRAMELQADLPEAQFALGIYYYWCHKDYALALDAFAVAELGMPSSADLKEFVGYIRRRQGRWAEAAEDLEASFALNPLDPWLAEEIGMTHSFLRNYAEAEHYLDASIALRPDQANSYLDKAELLWRTQGATEAAEIVLAAMHDNETPLAVMHIFLQQIFAGRFTDAVAQMERRQGEMFSHYRFTWPKALFRAQAYELAGETAKARRAYEASRGVLKQQLAAHPEDHRIRSALGLALAGLGQKEEALRQGRAAVDLYPLSGDSFFGVFPIADLALIYTKVGDDDAALDQIESLLSIPSLISVPLLELDPRFAPLRTHPRFKDLPR